MSILRSGGGPVAPQPHPGNLRKTHDVTLVATNGMAEIYVITPKADAVAATGEGRSRRSAARAAGDVRAPG